MARIHHPLVVVLMVGGCGFEVPGQLDQGLGDDRYAGPFVPELIGVEHATGDAPRADARVFELGDVDVATSRDGRVLWQRWHGADAWESTVVEGPLPHDARVVLADGPLYEAGPFLIAGDHAFPLPFDAGYAEPYPLERALGSWQLSDAQALDSTVLLAVLKTCPLSMQTCAVYGPPEDVEATDDPLEPETGFLLEELEAVVDELPPHQQTVTLADDEWAAPGAGRITLVVAHHADPDHLDPEDDDARTAVTRVLFEHRGRRLHAVDMPAWSAFAYADGVTGGVEELADGLMVWAWNREEIALGVSFHDRETGARIGPPRSVRASTYYEPECSTGLYQTRPIPVLGGDDLRFALTWNEGQAVLFDASGERSETVAEAMRDHEAAWLTLADDGSLR